MLHILHNSVQYAFAAFRENTPFQNVMPDVIFASFGINMATRKDICFKSCEVSILNNATHLFHFKLTVSFIVNSPISLLKGDRSCAVLLAGHGGGDVLVVILLVVRLLLVEERVVVEQHLLGQVGGVGVVGHHVADVQREVGDGSALLVAGLRLGDPLHEQAGGETTDDGEGHGDHHGSELPASLLGGGPAPLAPELLVALPVPLLVSLVEDAVPVPGEDLVEAGLGRVVVVLVAAVQEGVVRIVHVVGGDARHDDRDQAAKNGGHSVEVVDATGVGDLPPFLQVRRDELVA